MPWSDNLEPSSAAFSIARSTANRIRVMAGPGTGKSFAMKRRVARLLEDGVDPRRILAVTFTRVAAEDLHRELTQLNVSRSSDLEATTLHGLALRILMRENVLRSTGRIPRPLSEFEMEPLVCDLMREGRGKDRIWDLKAKFEAAWARLQTDTPGFTTTQEEREFEADLLGWLRFHKAMLIGEVIPKLHEYLLLNPLAEEKRAFDHVLVDEYQDLNVVEQEVIALLSENADVCIVGDDDQSIYSFKYAHPEGIREWSARNPGTSDFELTECRRCPTRVAQMAASLIQHDTNRPHPKVLSPLNANGAGQIEVFQYRSSALEIEGITNLVSQMVDQGTHPGSILVLTQSKVIGLPIYEELVALRIPAKSYFGETALKHHDAQRALELLRVLVNRDDLVALRWLIGVGGNNWHAAGYRRIRRHCQESDTSLWDVLAGIQDGMVHLPHTQRIVDQFADVRSELARLESHTDLMALIDDLFPAGRNEFRELRELATGILSQQSLGDRAWFARELSAAIGKPEIPTEVEEVRIMSLHKSKGLSAPVTIIAGCMQGVLPRPPGNNLSAGERALHLAEQRLLFYVGITRVKAVPSQGQPGRLILTFNQQMTSRDARSNSLAPSRFHGGSARFQASQFIRELGPICPRPIAR